MEQNKAESLYLELIPNLPWKESKLAPATGNVVRLFSVRESNNPPFSLTFPQSTSAFSQFRRHLLSGSFVSYESSARNVGTFFQKLRRDGNVDETGE